MERDSVYVRAVTEFKRELIRGTLCQHDGNRTRSAVVLGLQRTYLLRLMRELEIHVPPGQSWKRRKAGTG